MLHIILEFKAVTLRAFSYLVLIRIEFTNYSVVCSTFFTERPESGMQEKNVTLLWIVI